MSCTHPCCACNSHTSPAEVFDNCRIYNPPSSPYAKSATKLEKFLNAKQQGRLDGFFAVKPKTSPTKGKAEEKGKRTNTSLTTMR